MSLDIDIIAKRPVSIYEGNVKYNLADMYYKALDRKKGFKKLNGMSCKDALPILEKGIKDMIENKNEYKKLSPKNGWGTYEGLLKVFQDMRNVCETNPDGVIDVR